MIASLFLILGKGKMVSATPDVTHLTQSSQYIEIIFTCSRKKNIVFLVKTEYEPRDSGHLLHEACMSPFHSSVR